MSIIDKSTLKYRICCKCGNNETRIDISGKIYWFSCRCDKDNCTRYMCYYCYKNIGKSRIKHRDTMCCICGTNETFISSKSGVAQWYTHICDKENCTKYICNRCRMNIYNKLPDSYHNTIKALANCRTGNLYMNSNTGMSIIDQAIVIRVIGGTDMNIEKNNFLWSFDIEQEKYGKIDIKSSSLSYDTWLFCTRRKIDCDMYLLLGYDADRKNICAVWIIPNDQNIINSYNISITKNFVKYYKFKVDQTPYNDAYHDLMRYIGDKKSFGIEDIRKWFSVYI